MNPQQIIQSELPLPIQNNHLVGTKTSIIDRGDAAVCGGTKNPAASHYKDCNEDKSMKLFENLSNEIDEQLKKMGNLQAKSVSQNKDVIEETEEQSDENSTDSSVDENNENESNITEERMKDIHDASLADKCKKPISSRISLNTEVEQYESPDFFDAISQNEHEGDRTELVMEVIPESVRHNEQDEIGTKTGQIGEIQDTSLAKKYQNGERIREVIELENSTGLVEETKQESIEMVFECIGQGKENEIDSIDRKTSRSQNTSMPKCMDAENRQVNPMKAVSQYVGKAKNQSSGLVFSNCVQENEEIHSNLSARQTERIQGHSSTSEQLRQNITKTTQAKERCKHSGDAAEQLDEIQKILTLRKFYKRKQRPGNEVVTAIKPSDQRVSQRGERREENGTKRRNGPTGASQENLPISKFLKEVERSPKAKKMRKRRRQSGNSTIVTDDDEDEPVKMTKPSEKMISNCKEQRTEKGTVKRKQPIRDSQENLPNAKLLKNIERNPKAKNDHPRKEQSDDSIIIIDDDQDELVEVTKPPDRTNSNRKEQREEKRAKTANRPMGRSQENLPVAKPLKEIERPSNAPKTKLWKQKINYRITVIEENQDELAKRQREENETKREKHEKSRTIQREHQCRHLRDTAEQLDKIENIVTTRKSTNCRDQSEENRTKRRTRRIEEARRKLEVAEILKKYERTRKEKKGCKQKELAKTKERLTVEKSTDCREEYEENGTEKKKRAMDRFRENVANKRGERCNNSGTIQIEHRCKHSGDAEVQLNQIEKILAAKKFYERKKQQSKKRVISNVENKLEEAETTERSGKTISNSGERREENGSSRTKEQCQRGNSKTIQVEHECQNRGDAGSQLDMIKKFLVSKKFYEQNRRLESSALIWKKFNPGNAVSSTEESTETPPVREKQSRSKEFSPSKRLAGKKETVPGIPRKKSKSGS